MKKIIKFISLIFIAIFISCIFACVPVKSVEPDKEVETPNDGLEKLKYHYRAFIGTEPAAQGYNLYFNDMVNNAAYLCAWHGGIFFNFQPIVIKYDVEIFGHQYTGTYTAKETWEHFVVGGSERPTVRVFHMTRGIGHPDGDYEYDPINADIDTKTAWSSFKLTMIAEKYSGNKYIDSIATAYGYSEGKRQEATVTSTGWTRFWVTERHHEKNNAMSYLLADCNDNAGVVPRASYVNHAFWAHLGDTSTQTDSFSKPGDDASIWESMGNIPKTKGTPSTPDTSVSQPDLQNIGSSNSVGTLGGISASKVSESIAATTVILKEVEWYLQALEEGKKLTDEQCDALYNTALAEQEDKVAYNFYLIIKEYKESDKKDNEIIEKLKEALNSLIKDMNDNSKNDDQKEETQQNAEDYNTMWEEIGEKYEDTISDKTVQDDVTVEYNATTQKYLIGPFQIEYVEKYTSDYILAGMAGDPILTVRKDASVVTIPRSSGKWNFYYLNGLRVEGIPGTGSEGVDIYGYNEYPHNNEPFYIQLDYEDGINAILGIEVFFRYMQSEAEWSKSEGEIENVNWEGYYGSHDCKFEKRYEGGKVGKCDGGAPDIEGVTHDDSEGGHTHWHVNDSEDGDHTFRTGYNCNNKTATYKCPGHPCGDPDCSSSHKCSGPLGCEGYYTCNGHTCDTNEAWGAEKCSHGYYANHYAAINLFFNGKFAGSCEPIQYIGTCHWAWRLYFDVNKKIEWNIDITTGLAGDVWLDIDAQKDEAHANVKDGDKEDVEHGVQDVLVTIKLYQDGEEKAEAIAHDDAGNRISWPQRTDTNGHYEVNRIEAPGIVGGKDCYYVAEFAYDGQVYESTVFLQNGDGDDTATQYTDAKGQGYFSKSMAVERYPERRTFDETFSEISGGSPMNADYTTTGNSPGGSIEYKPSEDKMKKVSEDLSKDSDKDLRRSEFISAATEDHENMKSGWESTYDRYRMQAYTYYADGEGITPGSQIEDYQIRYPFDEKGKAYGTGEIRYIMNNNRDGASGGKRYIDEYMLHINLGLKKRKETDISVLKDLYKMTIVVNEQEIVQNFNCLGGPAPDGTITIKDNAGYKTLKEVLENRRSKPNELGLYSTDIAYSSKSRYSEAIDQVKKIKENTELRVFATYAVRVYNNSDTNDVTINEITDYYDSTYTLIDNENDGIEGMEAGKDGVYTSIVKEDLERVKKLVADKPYYRVLPTNGDYDDISWKPTKEENLASSGIIHKDKLTWSTSGEVDGMKKSTTSSLKNLKLKVNQYAEIFTTYEVDYEGFDVVRGSSNIGTRSNLTGEKNNVAEVSKYSTFYSERDVQTEGGSSVNFYKAYKEEDISGKIDKDSAPDNIQTSDITNMEYYEDDTCRAIPLNIQVESVERDMYGYVFEDKKDKAVGKYDLKTGNGIYESGEYLIPNVKVSMFEVISLADCNEALENKSDIALNDLEYYYEIPQDFYNGGHEVLTNSATVGVNGNYQIKGFLPADYVLRFDYGINSDATATLYSMGEDGNELVENNVPIIKYNGQDYENTSFLSETKYGTGSAINDKYLNLRTEDMKNVQNKDGIKAVTQVDGSKAYSTARDNETRRMVVNAFSRNIENDRGEILRDRRADDDLYVEATSMFAETPIMQIEVNQPKDLNKDTNLKNNEKTEVVKTIDSRTKDLMNQQYSIKNINFGLEERAKTDIRVEQYIESIYLMKEDDIIFSATLQENGKVITENKDNKGLDKLTYLAHEEAINSNQQGFYAISVEDDYLNGLSMNIDYRIKMINESETDFTGYLADYDTPAKIIDAASYSPTTEAYTKDIENLLAEDNTTGMATNATLAELFKIANREPDGAILKDLLASDATNTNIKPKDTIRPDIIVYGKYVGTYYYENILNETGNKKSIINQYKWVDMDNIEITYNVDKVVETTVDQLIDYIDTNASYDLSTQNFENCAWDLSGKLDANTTERRTIPTLNELVSESSYRTIDAQTESGTTVGKSNIYDRKGNALVTDVSSNIVIARNNKLTTFTNNDSSDEGESTLSGKDTSYRADTYLTDEIAKAWVKYREQEVKAKDNKALTIGLVPKAYNEDDSKVEMWIMTAKTTASDTDANNMKFDNLVEVLVYSNPTGRRDVYSVPGNAMALATQGEVTTKDPSNVKEEMGFWKAGYNSKDYWMDNSNPTITDEMAYREKASAEWTRYPEDDAYAPEFVTIIAPTGITLREYIRNVIVPITILVIIVVVMLGIFGVKQIKIRKMRDEF